MSRQSRKKGAGQGRSRAEARRLVRRARHVAKEARRLARRKRRKVSPEVAELVATEAKDLRAAIRSKDRDVDAIEQQAIRLDGLVEEHFARFRKSATREYVESILWAVAIALFIRAFFFEAFKIPTGSMIPSLHIGDHIFVNKFIYGIRLPWTDLRILDWREPHRGEIVVFEYPGPGVDHGKDFIKRVIAVPGDRVRMKDHVIRINGEPLFTMSLGPRWATQSCIDNVASFCECSLQFEDNGGYGYVTQHHASNCPTYPDWPRAEPECSSLFPEDCLYFGARGDNPDWPEVVIPEDHILCMGDNRDNSHDGRYWGLVPLKAVKGKAFVIWWAKDLSRVFSLVH